jgi:hypothetical protein
MLIHHTNLEDAEPDRRRLVCYDCGVACDLSKMREDRLVALRALGAERRPARGTPVGAGVAAVSAADAADAAGAAALIDVSERGGGSPAERPDLDEGGDGRGGGDGGDDGREGAARARQRETERAERVRLAGHVGAGAPYTTYRIRFAKVGRAAFLGHLDLSRLLARSFRRADLPLAMTRGFSPKPRLAFGPALGLGVPSLGELFDVDLEHLVPGHRSWDAPEGAPRVELPADLVRERLAAVCPPGVEILACSIVRLSGHPALARGGRPDQGLGKLIDAIDVAICPASDGMAFDEARLRRIAAAFFARTEAPLLREGGRTIDVRALVTELDVISGEAAERLCAALDWPAAPLLRARVRSTAEGSAKPQEVARALGVWGPDDPRATHAAIARLGVVPAGKVESAAPQERTSPAPA